MGAYSLVIGTIGILLHTGWAKDEAVYALIVCLPNFAKIYRNNCRAKSPMIQGSLCRLFFAIRKWAVIRDQRELVSKLT